MEPIITLKNLSKSYRLAHKEPGLLGSFWHLFRAKTEEVRAVQNVSLQIMPGEFIGLLGPNGAGKTTIIKMLAGILYPTSGAVRVLNFTPTERKTAFLKQISLVMGQKPYIWNDVPPLDSYELMKQIYDIPDDAYRKRLDQLTDILDLTKIATIQTRRLSLGERMRAELAGALLHDPKVLFLDEPTIGLDVVAQKRLWEFLKKYQQEQNLTIILTSHYMADIERLSSRVLVLSGGKFVYDGTLNQLRQASGLQKRLTVTFEERISEANLAKFGQILSLENTTATLGVAKTDIAKLVANLLRRHSVTDLAIQEPEAADVIRELFEKTDRDV